MESAKKVRTVHRSAITRACNNLQKLVENPKTDPSDIHVIYEIVRDNANDLEMANKRVFEEMIASNCSEEEFELENISVEEYKMKFLRVKLRVSERLKQNSVAAATGGEVRHSVTSDNGPSRRSFKLPTIELKKFSGDVKDWLQFWSQFKKIHEDATIGTEDKFQYLLQAMTDGSRASELVNSFPPSGENYTKVIKSLKSRFGRDELLVEVYVRELLKLVLQNAVKSNSKPALSSLYDKIESHIRALETLGVTTDKCAAMLYPLVESALPEEILRAWQRCTVLGNDIESKERLTSLLKFIASEVENEERIAMAVQGFGINNESENSRKVDSKKSKSGSEKRDIPTATTLLAAKDEKSSCAFCSGGHQSSDCLEARQMTQQEKLAKLKQKNCCFNCTKSGHAFRKCRANLSCAWCGKKHVVVMCPEVSTRSKSTEQKTKLEQKSKTETKIDTDSNLANFENIPEVLLQTVRVKLFGEKTERDVRAIIDTGSQRSYVTKDAAQAVGLTPVGCLKLTHNLFGGVKSQEQEHNRYKVRLGHLRGTYHCRFEVLENEQICSNIPNVRVGPWAKEIKRLKIELSDVHDVSEPIQVLIGADVAGKLMTGKSRILESGPVAVETLLGWTLMGKVAANRERSDTAMTVFSMFQTETDIANLWQLDVLGISDPVRKQSVEEREKSVEEDFRRTVRLNEEKRYEVQLPWINDHPPLPSNRAMAEKRLETTTKRLQGGGHFNGYDEVLHDWLEEGIIERVPAAEIGNSGHYLPHRHVIKKDSTTKIRPVFDASAREKHHPSLNLCLEKGPNLIELIPAILARFRMAKIGVIADVKKAFLQISIRKEDRDFLRFLWWSREAEQEIVEFRHCRVVFGVSCSPFLLGAVINMHLEKSSRNSEDSEQRTMFEKLKRSFYVDDCITSVDTIDELDRFVEESTDVMATGGFELRGWEKSGQDERTKVLGLVWDKKCDTLEINLATSEKELPEKITKRIILSTAQALFDPIGFTAPVSLCPKVLLQEAWSLNIDWDTELNDDIKTKFIVWFQELQMLSEIKISRHLFNGTENPKNLSLHVFCDASQVSYAAVIYIRSESIDGVTLQLVQAKSRVAPKKTTIPRLELLAATIGARLMAATTKALDLHGISTFFWSDSTTVLSWIQRECEWSVFVWNRIQEIRKLTNYEDWRHVPGEMNPADLPSRGCSVKSLLASKWWEGPEWLLSPSREWPSSSFTADEKEIRMELKKSATTMISGAQEIPSCGWVCQRRSGYREIMRLMAYVWRFVKNCRSTMDERKSGDLSMAEIEEAKMQVFKCVQRESFKNELDARFGSLNAFKAEDGLIRLNTKIAKRQDLYDFRFPIVLPSNHPIIHSLVYERHVELCHAGVQTVMVNLRENFWILGGRRTIRSIIQKCVVCKRQDVKSFEPKSTSLPLDRVREAAVFEISGVDFAGPVYLVEKQKAWICLFTCAVYRAVHLELVTSLSTSAFIEAFRRFVARRGRPHTMYSDNGTNFVGTENLFKRIDWKRVSDYSGAKRIRWIFNPPSAAWWGGWWERLVGLVKRLLRRVLGRACLTYEEMMTTLCDCESVINSRPITYVSDDSNDLISLSPSMFLQEIRELGVPDCDNIDRSSMTKRLRYKQKLRDDLRRRFRAEYLGQLIQRNKTNSEKRVPKVGDVVMIGNDIQKRLEWPLARVVDTIAGNDGEIRVVRLKTASGEVTRPVQRIYPLELSSDESRAMMEKQIENLPETNGVETTQKDEKSGSDSIVPETTSTTRRGRVIKQPERYRC